MVTRPCPPPAPTSSPSAAEMPEAEQANVVPSGAPRASLICRPNSHPFQDRMLSLDQAVKVGRSVARARPVQTNAIFDCKVLSRNHALLWYENGKFYLQDTKSSNGTFVNNQRLSKGSEESPPREVCSGDILQFGVDVMENSRKVTHGCIIATLKLYLPDGKEAKASPSIVNTSPNSPIPAQDLYQLNQYIQEALAREQLLEKKLVGLQKLVGETETATNQSWKALMDEDRLLTRVEILESQLTTYGKSMTEEKLREETKRLMGEKEIYQNTAKDTLKRLTDEKLDTSKKLKDVEKSLMSLEDEYSSLKLLYEKVVADNKVLSEKVTDMSEELMKRNQEEINDMNESQTDLKKSEIYIKSDIIGENKIAVDSNGKYFEDDELDKTDNELVIQSSRESLDNDVSELDERTDVPIDNDYDTEDDVLMNTMKNADKSSSNNESVRLKHQLEELKQSKAMSAIELDNLRINLDEAKNENMTIFQELENTRNKLMDADKLINSQEQLVKDLEEKLGSELKNSESNNRAISQSQEWEKMLERIHELEAENRLMKSQLFLQEQELSTCKARSALSDSPLKEVDPSVTSQEKVQDSDHGSGVEELSSSLPISQTRETDVHNLSSSSLASEASQVSLLEQSLEEAEGKIAKLLRVKERLVSVQTEKSQLEADVSNLEEELSVLSSLSRGLTACTLGPLLVLLVAVVLAFLPSFSSTFGTKDF